ncbi:MAG: CBS domain-containing protein [Thermodesulfobacteriota bacterium]
MSPSTSCENTPLDISDTDILAAMKSIPGYIDITPADFREVYRAAYLMARQRMMAALKASDIMRRPVHTVREGDDLTTAAMVLAENGISGAPVIDNTGRVTGVISEKDFLRRMGAGTDDSFMRVIAHCLKNKGCLAEPMLNRKVADIMTSPAVTAPADISLKDISAVLSQKGINRLPIVDAGGKPSGIVTRSDLVNSFCQLG